MVCAFTKPMMAVAITMAGLDVVGGWLGGRIIGRLRWCLEFLRPLKRYRSKRSEIYLQSIP